MQVGWCFLAYNAKYLEKDQAWHIKVYTLKSIIQWLYNTINRFKSDLAICKIIYPGLFDGNNQCHSFQPTKDFYVWLVKDIFIDWDFNDMYKGGNFTLKKFSFIAWSGCNTTQLLIGNSIAQKMRLSFCHFALQPNILNYIVSKHIKFLLSLHGNRNHNIKIEAIVAVKHFK